VVPPAEFLQGLQELCARHGVLTIADEIQTGFGRTGSFLASDTFGFDPDIITLGKSLASGLPLSAVVGRSEIMDAPGDNAIGGTYVGNPVACAAAIAVLDVIEEEGLIERAEHLGKDIRSRWEEIGEQMPQLGEIRGVGAMIGVEFVQDPETKAPAKDLIGRLVNGALQKGVISISCGIHKNVLRHLMPLVISDEQLAEGLDVLTDAALAARG
jgi:4-aminobutyrate aminotransferase/(S)-3-amino-2-methylpropionate transaminase